METEVPALKCASNSCHSDAVAEFHWPGKTVALCRDCGTKAHGLARVLGFSLAETRLEPLAGSRCDGCGEFVSDIDAGFSPGMQGMGHTCGGTWRIER